MIRRFYRLIAVSCLVAINYTNSAQTALSSKHQKDFEQIANLQSNTENVRKEALAYIQKNWDENFAMMVLETLYLTRDNAFTIDLFETLIANADRNNKYDVQKWQEWLWNKSTNVPPYYAKFKKLLYRKIDPKFSNYFDDEYQHEIRLDEIVWGGVKQDGIPPLRSPKMIAAEDARYLQNENIVFGIEINGEAMAYPKRILAWHEMFVDNIAGIPVAGVYCTLCGAMILYKTKVKGINHELGTSGFLYRSNKLMYDKATQSLWNTIWGKPVVGPLVGQGIELEQLSVVTTTWKDWKKRHPSTKVLDINTGYRRDYGEGVAYRDYFATDELMFSIPDKDKRLANKDEVFGLLLNSHPDLPLAFSTKFLKKHSLYHHQVDDEKIVILTDNSGAIRAYASNNVTFIDWDRYDSLLDSNNTRWTLTEAWISSNEGQKLYRLPSHNAFWFGWYAAYGHTKLIK